MCVHIVAFGFPVLRVKMALSILLQLLRWDFMINRGASWDSIRAVLLLFEVRIEQYIYQNVYKHGGMFRFLWFLIRGFGVIFQWFLCNSNIPGSTTIGRGLRLPHPQNIIIAAYADIGEFCTIYHNVSIAWNGFKKTVPHSPKIGERCLFGAGAIVIGDIVIGENVLVGAGTVVSRDIPSNSTATSSSPVIRERHATEDAAEAGSSRHIADPYSIWR